LARQKFFFPEKFIFDGGPTIANLGAPWQQASDQELLLYASQSR
jgi:hypothetical protein